MYWDEFCKLSLADMLLYVRKAYGWEGHYHFRDRIWNAKIGISIESLEDVYTDAYNLLMTRRN